jgi:23S rRNA (guanosine2251-2'-O)-methyltransferase
MTAFLISLPQKRIEQRQKLQCQRRSESSYLIKNLSTVRCNRKRPYLHARPDFGSCLRRTHIHSLLFCTKSYTISSGNSSISSERNTVDVLNSRNECLSKISGGKTHRLEQNKILQNQPTIQDRKNILRDKLIELNIDADTLDSCTIQNIEDPIRGYDGRYGKSAIKTYRSFVYTNDKSNIIYNKNEYRKEKVDEEEERDSVSVPSVNPSFQTNLIAHAGRTARQIHFLMNRHKSHCIQSIRHHDGTKTDVVALTANRSSIDDHERRPQQFQDGQDKENDIMEMTNQQIPTKFPIVLVLDNVRSAYNVGNIFRTADATNIGAVYTVGITPHPNGNGDDKLQKSSLGSQYVVPTKHFRTIQSALEHIHRISGNRDPNLEELDHDVSSVPNDTRGCQITIPNEANQIESKHDNNSEYSTLENRRYIVLGMETTSLSIKYTDYKYDRKRGIVLILGNEVTGVDPAVFSTNRSSSYVDDIIEIPMFGVKNSLNIAACVPIVVYEIIRQWTNPT